MKLLLLLLLISIEFFFLFVLKQNTKPVVGTNGRSSQPQSRRGSLYDSQRRLSQQSTSGQLVENQLSSNIPLEADDKYLQDSFET